MRQAAVCVWESVTTIHLHGVDFSGADNGGLHKIRIASRNAGGAVTVDRADRATLVRLILESSKSDATHIWRIDAPGGIPLQTLRAHGVAERWIDSARWAAESGSPRAWRTRLREVSREEPRRHTDADARTPMAPMNLRLFKQTWTLICEVLVPLHEQGISIAPMARTQSNATVCEGCPASVLHRLGWPARGYKGDGEPPKRVRALIARRLGEIGITIAPSLMQKVVEDTEGDLLDALILLMPPTQTVIPADGLVEGWVY
ncbi:MAG: hypothetical protein EXS15_07910 [Phycisphaerales bacterium]|nr:hypothetical protein [Phycisphaerales bacterium]